MKFEVVEKKPEFWFLLLIIVGYVIASAFAIPLGFEDYSKYFAVPFRTFIFVFSLFIIYRNFSWNRMKNISVISMLMFWIFYIIKAIWSINTDAYNQEFIAFSHEIYFRVFLIVVTPSLALMIMDYKQINFFNLGKYVFFVFLIMLGINLLYGLALTIAFPKLPIIFSIYYISYGHLGASLAIISLFYILFEHQEEKKYIYIIGLLVGLSTVFFATARSPFLALVIVSFYFVLVKRNLKYFLLFLGLNFLIITGIWWLVKNGYNDFKFVTRTYAWLFEGDNSLRTPLFERSIELFKAKPVFGSRILFEDGSYPHNIFLELLMATGVFGLILYFLKFIPMLKKLKLFFGKNNNTYYILFFALFLQYFVLVITSYSLFSVPEFVHLSALIIGISLNKTYEEA